jgi:alkanesulfonate monooxygenase SsuD/methylene tetrahydromethanopterin reductase-like flavin-dependent oxidoreductase (luciferase family)
VGQPGHSGRGDVPGAVGDGGGAARRARSDLAKSIATLDHLSGGWVSLGVGFGWNTDELADHNVPPGRRRTMLREYLAMRALWTQEEASFDGEFVKFGPSWAWPKPVQPHIPVLVGAAGSEKNFKWIARSADGWITTPRDFDIDAPVKLLRRARSPAMSTGAPANFPLGSEPGPTPELVREDPLALA